MAYEDIIYNNWKSPGARPLPYLPQAPMPGMPPAVKPPMPPAPVSALPPVAKPMPPAPVSAMPPAPMQTMPPAAPPKVKPTGASGYLDWKIDNIHPSHLGSNPTPSPAPPAVDPLTNQPKASTTPTTSGRDPLTNQTPAQKGQSARGSSLTNSADLNQASSGNKSQPNKKAVGGKGAALGRGLNVAGLALLTNDIKSDSGQANEIAYNLKMRGIEPSPEMIAYYQSVASNEVPTTDALIDQKLAERERLGIPNSKGDPNNRDAGAEFWDTVTGGPLAVMGPAVGWAYNKLFKPDLANMTPEQVNAQWNQMQLEGKLPEQQPVSGGFTDSDVEKSTGNQDSALGDTSWLPNPLKTARAAKTPGVSSLDFLDNPEINRQDARGPMTQSRIDARQAAQNADSLSNAKLTDKDAAMIRAAQAESDFNKGRASAEAAIAADGGSLVDVQPKGTKEGQSVRYAGTDSSGNAQYEIYGKDGLQGTMAVPQGTLGNYGGRQGGGTLSVISGRTKEEQDAIDERVKQINGQTDAMRSLRNAHRQAQGLPTVEQEEQMNAMQAMMSRFTPDLSRFDEQQAALMKQLQDAQGIRGFGKGRQRRDAMEAAQVGLSQIAAARNAAQQQGQTGLNFAQSMMQNQATNEQARAKAAQEQQQWAEQYGLDASKLTNEQQQAQADYLMKAYGLSQKDAENALAQQRLGLDAWKAQRGDGMKIDSRMMGLLYDKDNMGNPTSLNPERTGQYLSMAYGIKPRGDNEELKPGVRYFDPQTLSVYMYDPQTGKRIDIGLTNQ